LLSLDTVQVQEYNGDFIVMEDGIYFVQEDEAGEYSQGFKIQQEGTFTAVETEGRLIQENDTFTLLEAQSPTGDLSLTLESTTTDALAGLQETVYVELEESEGGDSAVRADKISHVVYEDDTTDTIQILNEEEFSNFKVEEFESVLYKKNNIKFN